MGASSAGLSHYQELGVPPDANGSQIKRAFHKEALRRHPDKNPGNPNAKEDFQRLSKAHDILSDPEKRKAYDEALKGQPAQTDQPAATATQGAAKPSTAPDPASGTVAVFNPEFAHSQQAADSAVPESEEAPKPTGDKKKKVEKEETESGKAQKEANNHHDDTALMKAAREFGEHVLGPLLTKVPTAIVTAPFKLGAAAVTAAANFLRERRNKKNTPEDPSAEGQGLTAAEQAKDFRKDLKALTDASPEEWKQLKAAKEGEELVKTLQGSAAGRAFHQALEDAKTPAAGRQQAANHQQAAADHHQQDTTHQQQAMPKPSGRPQVLAPAGADPQDSQAVDSPSASLQAPELKPDEPRGTVYRGPEDSFSEIKQEEMLRRICDTTKKPPGNVKEEAQKNPAALLDEAAEEAAKAAKEAAKALQGVAKMTVAAAGA